MKHFLAQKLRGFQGDVLEFQVHLGLKIGKNYYGLKYPKFSLVHEKRKLNLNIPGTWMAALAQRAKIESNFIFVEFFESG